MYDKLLDSNVLYTNNSLYFMSRSVIPIMSQSQLEEVLERNMMIVLFDQKNKLSYFKATDKT